MLANPTTDKLDVCNSTMLLNSSGFLQSSIQVFEKNPHLFTQGVFYNTAFPPGLQHPKSRTLTLRQYCIQTMTTCLLLGAVQTQLHIDAFGVKPPHFPKLHLFPCHSTAQVYTGGKRRKKTL